MFHVNPDELTILSAAISRVRDQLDGTRDLVADCTPALGSDVVAAALEHFASGWRDGRKQIASEVGALSEMLAQAAATYIETDGDLAAAIPGAS
jgi:hypothetical protein